MAAMGRCRSFRLRLESHLYVGMAAFLWILAAGGAAYSFEARQWNDGALVGRAKVIDGDSLDLGGTQIRLFGIDAPEGRQTCLDAAGRNYRCGRSATKALRRLVGRSVVRCEKRDIDGYGRTVAVCFKDGIDLNGWMAENGWAVAYRHYSRDYVAAEERARAARLGIWAGRFEEPRLWRREHD
jgi:endonuclease YncB( thermonuclease family)